MIEYKIKCAIDNEALKKSILKSVNQMLDNVKLAQVDVGYTEKSGVRTPTQEEIQSNTDHEDNYFDEKRRSYMRIARYNEYGNIRTPARPFMQYTREQLDRLRDLGINEFTIKGNKVDWEETLEKIAKRVANNIRIVINNVDWQKNSKRTVEAKGRDDPLNWTGGLLDNIVNEKRLVR